MFSIKRPRRAVGGMCGAQEAVCDIRYIPCSISQNLRAELNREASLSYRKSFISLSYLFTISLLFSFTAFSFSQKKPCAPERVLHVQDFKWTNLQMSYR